MGDALAVAPKVREAARKPDLMWGPEWEHLVYEALAGAALFRSRRRVAILNGNLFSNEVFGAYRVERYRIYDYRGEKSLA